MNNFRFILVRRYHLQVKEQRAREEAAVALLSLSNPKPDSSAINENKGNDAGSISFNKSAGQ